MDVNNLNEDELMMQPQLQRLRAAVTGGTSGLGRALVAELLRRGARVAFVARHADEVRRTTHELQGSYGIVGDVSRKDDIYPLALQITGTLGGLDVLVNNASSLGPVPLALLADTNCEDFELALATTFWVHFASQRPCSAPSPRRRAREAVRLS